MNAESSSTPFWTRRKAGCFVLILVGLMLACFLMNVAAKWVVSQRNKMETILVMRELADSMIKFKAESGHWPPSISKNGNAHDLEMRSKGPLIKCLLALSDPSALNENPRGMKFFDAPIARNGNSFGLVESSSLDGSKFMKLIDIWGEDYYILIDLNGDGEIANPAAGRLSSSFPFKQKAAPATVAATVVVYSAGPDRDPKTWEDNILSVRK